MSDKGQTITEISHKLQKKRSSVSTSIHILREKNLVKVIGLMDSNCVYETTELGQTCATTTNISDAQQPNPEAKMRKCLKCRDDFLSEWSGERVCKACKDTDAYKTGDTFFDPIGYSSEVDYIPL